MNKEFESQVLDIRNELKTLIRDIEHSYIRLARGLIEVETSKLYIGWGFENFADFVENDLNIKYRRARYYIQIYKLLVKIYNIDSQVLSQIGWAKASRIATASNHGQRSRKEVLNYIKLAESETLRTVEDKLHIKIKKDHNQFSVNLHKDQSDNVKACMELMKKVTDSDNMNHNLDTACCIVLASQVIDDNNDVSNLDYLIFRLTEESMKHKTKDQIMEFLNKYSKFIEEVVNEKS